MKFFVSIITLFLIAFSVDAQKRDRGKNIDSVDFIDGKTLYILRFYNSEGITLEGTAFLIPDTLIRKKLFGIIKTRTEVEWIKWHGTVKNFPSNQYYKLSEYDNGKLLFIKYYNKDGTEITQAEFIKPYGFVTICVDESKSYLIYGKIKN